MIGDGANDAPAMAVSTVAIALMKDGLSKVAESIRLGRRTLRIVQFNIVFSLAVKAV